MPEYLVKFVDDEGNERTVYANADNEYEAEQIAMSKAQNSHTHKYAFENFGSNTRIEDVYEKDSYDDDYYENHKYDDPDDANWWR